MVTKIRSVSMIFNHLRFANDCLACRLSLRLTTDDVGGLVGLDKSTIAKYESGKEDNMKINHFLALINVYDLDPRDYFELFR